MKIQFTKMHGAGNDFVVLDGIRQSLTLTPDLIRRLADRHFGIGADQVLVVEPPSGADADFRYRIFNADGGEVEQCGNGARCFVKFVRDAGLTDHASVRVEVAKGVATLKMRADGQVVVEMGAPDFEPDHIPFDAQGLIGRREREDTLWPLDVLGNVAWISAVSLGNPHAVQIVEDVERARIAIEGPAIERHLRFPQRVNAGFMQIVDPHTIKLRVFERGAGETLACGTGACAAAVAGIRRGVLQSPVDVDMRGGRLTIEWDGADVRMIGPAATVFTGEIEL